MTPLLVKVVGKQRIGLLAPPSFPAAAANVSTPSLLCLELTLQTEALPILLPGKVNDLVGRIVALHGGV